MAEFDAIIALSSLDGTTGFRLDGAASFDVSGLSVASAGDINGDGFDDLIIGAYGADPNGSLSGSSYVVFGKPGGFAATLDLSALDGTDGFRLDGVALEDLSGYSVASAGDVNGDGFDDLIIGAPSEDPDSDPNSYGDLSGVSYVVFGKADGFASSLDLAALDGTNGFRLDGAVEYGESGYSVASAGDVNGDGFDDIIVGAPFADANGSSSGISHVVFGHAGGFPPSIDLSTLDGTNGFRLDGVAAGDESGLPVASAGDINGDGFDDVIVGAHGADPNGSFSGSSYVVFGKANGFAASIDLSALDGTDGFRLDGAAAFDVSGRSVASAGDVDGDGFDDLIIGAFRADPNGNMTAGSSYVVFGKAAGFAEIIDLGTLDGTDGFRLDGAAAEDHSGFSVASAGDVNGDGFDDLIIGAYRADPNGNSSAGSSYVVFGNAGGFAASFDLATLDGTDGFRLDGAAADDRSGFSVASAGDVDGDGFDDLIIGAYGADPNGTQSGSSYVVFGRAPDAAVTRVGSAADQKIMGGAFDDTLSGLGGADDLRGGGGNDTLLGGLGGDALDGGAGIDLASYRNAAAAVLVNLANAASNTGEAAGDSYVGIENLEGSGFADDLSGDGAANVLFGRAGDDSIYGRAGDDSVYGGPGDDLLYGGPGDDLLVGGGGLDVLRGGPGEDTLVGGADADRLLGGGDTDILRGGGGDDILRGHAGDDRLLGAAGSDNLHGGGGNDILRGGAGDDILRGGPGDNLLVGNGGHDRLIGGNHADELYGQGGNDLLLGGGGNDRLVGGAGNDQLIGGAGDDELTGNGDADLFVFQPNGGNDVVTDFQDGVDLLDFGAFGFAGKPSVLSLAAQVGADVVFTLPGGETVELTAFDITLLGGADIVI